MLHIFAGQVTWDYGFQAGKVLQKYQGLFGPKFAVKMPKKLGKLLEQCFRLPPEDLPKNMLEIASALQQISHDLCGHAYSHRQPKDVEQLAATLNNRAVSLVDLGLQNEAVKLWERCLQTDARFAEANFKLGLIRGELED